jgi:hypothetical protein
MSRPWSSKTKLRRRQFVQGSVSAILSGWATNNSKTLALDEKKSAAEKLSLRKLRIEPLTRTSFVPHERIRGQDTDQMEVLVFADGLPNNYWFLNLPEQIYLNGQKFHYQIGMDWKKQGNAWFYDDCPIRNLLGCWKSEGGKLRLQKFNEEEHPVVGRQSARIEIDALGARYQIGVANASGLPFRDVYIWVCFNHFQSPQTGYRPYLRMADRLAKDQ